ncbi:hypothetical protein V502_04107 [Pseudogymnoascus sp. VKM F-4520 (FW-2644)]|nr:hypothetical protein V502_04107 [Pseudogymnoascus sp. VKM F-4520 (FW-2644)]
MGWFDGASEVASSYILDGYGGGDRRASPSRSSRHGGSSGHKKHKSHKSHKTETGSAFGDWAAGAPEHAQRHPRTAVHPAAASSHAPTPASVTYCAS